MMTIVVLSFVPAFQAPSTWPTTEAATMPTWWLLSTVDASDPSSRDKFWQRRIVLGSLAWRTPGTWLL